MIKPVKAAYSLQRLFLSRLLLIIVPFAIAVLWGAYWVTLHYANAAFDRSLVRRAYALADQVEVVNGKAVLDLPQVAHSVLEFDPSDVFYYRVLGPDGEQVAGGQELNVPANFHLGDGRHVFFDAMVEDDKVRVVAYSLSLKGTHAQGNVLILTGETIAKREKLAEEILLTVLLPMIGIVLVLTLMINLGVKMGLKPIQEIREAIARRGAHNLDPIEIEMQNLPVEIEPLLVQMNQMVADLRAIHDSRQRFLADSAHQLRTPLASMRAQAELLARSARDKDSQETLAGLLNSLDRQSRLVNQLLALSRVENILVHPSLETIRLDELARDITIEWVPRALEQDIDLGFDPPEAKVVVLGNAHALSDALSNLLDNALQYCRAGDHVTVRVSISDGQACLSVSDTGPGIAEAALPKLFERFYRVPGTQTQGCGLGLAIVREVIEGHGGRVSIQNAERGGLVVRMCIPRVIEETG